MERLGSLPPAFRDGGSVTAGNSCPLNDGAVAAVLVEEDLAERDDLPVRAGIGGTSVSGIDPAMVGARTDPGGVYVAGSHGTQHRGHRPGRAERGVRKSGPGSSRELGIDTDEQLNTHGGALALGHPFGMTGLRLIGTLVNGLESTGGRLGLVTLCVGGGQGMAMRVERP